MDYINKLFTYIGFFGPIVLVIFSIILLIKKTILLRIFFIGLGVNTLLNIILKILIKDPRPKDDIPLFEAELAHDKRRISFDRFGMPSGHAQTVGYTLGFILFSVKSYFITNTYLSLTLITMWQRYFYRNHSLAQLLVGLTIGFTVGYLFYWIATKKIMGPINAKHDDNAPFF